MIFLFSVKDLVKFRLGAADSRGHNHFLTDVKVHPSLYLSIFHFFPSNSLRFCRHCIEMSTASRAPRIPADIPPASSTSMRFFHYTASIASPPPSSSFLLLLDLGIIWSRLTLCRLRFDYDEMIKHKSTLQLDQLFGFNISWRSSRDHVSNTI